MGINLIREAMLNLDKIPNFSYQNRVLKYHNRVAFGSGGNIRRRLITALHDSQLGGTFWVQASYMTAKHLFY